MMRLFKAIVLFLFLVSSTISFGESQGTSGATGQTIIDYARQHINETTAGFWTDAALLQYVNWAQMDVAEVTRCMETTEVEKLTTGTTMYAISTRYFGVEKALYEAPTTTYTNNYKALKRVDINEIGLMEDAEEPVRYAVWNDYFIVDPKPISGVSGYYVILYLSAKPTSLTSATSSVVTPAIYDDALALFVAARACLKDRDFNAAQKFMELYRDTLKFHMERLMIERKSEAPK